MFLLAYVVWRFHVRKFIDRFDIHKNENHGDDENREQKCTPSTANCVVKKSENTNNLTN